MTTQTVLPLGAATGAWRGESDKQSTDTLIARLQRRWAAYKLYRSTFEELQMLSDRELSDIGIARGDIRKIAQASADAAIVETRHAA